MTQKSLQAQHSSSFQWEILNSDNNDQYDGPLSLQPFGKSAVLSVSGAEVDIYNARIKVTDSFGRSDIQSISIDVFERINALDSSQYNTFFNLLPDGSLGITCPVSTYSSVECSFDIVEFPLHGTLQIIEVEDSFHGGYRNRLEYTAGDGFLGFDSFEYQVTHDGNIISAEPLRVGAFDRPLEIQLVPDSPSVTLSDSSIAYKLTPNFDDDDGNGTPDNNDDFSHAPHSKENDLVAVSIETSFANSDIREDATFFLAFSNTNNVGPIRAWDSPTKDNEIFKSSHYTADELPEKIWIEGIGFGVGSSPTVSLTASLPTYPLKQHFR